MAFLIPFQNNPPPDNMRDIPMISSLVSSLHSYIFETGTVALIVAGYNELSSHERNLHLGENRIMAPKNYFIIPSAHYPDTAITLGSILSSPTSPESSINSSEVLTPRTRYVSVIYNHTNPTNTTSAHHYTRKHGISAPWAHEIGVNLGLHFDSTRKQESGDWHFDKIEKSLMVPDDEYVDRAMSQSRVKRWMSENSGKGMWMVTGVQIAKGARRHGETKSRDLRDSGISMGNGGISSTAMRQDSDEIGKGSDFVYAYRVNEIGYHKRKFTMKGLQSVRTSTDTIDSEPQSRSLGRKSGDEKRIEDTFLLPEQEEDLSATQLRRIKEMIASDAMEGDDGQYEVMWV